MNEVDGFIQVLCEAPDSQIDKTQVEKLQGLIGKPPKEQVIVLKSILDDCANYSLASGFCMVSIDICWKMALAIKE